MLVPDFAEEALVRPSAAVELSLGQQPQQRANVRNDCLRKLNQPKTTLRNLVSKFCLRKPTTSSSPSQKSRDSASATEFSLPGNHCEK